MVLFLRPKAFLEHELPRCRQVNVCDLFHGQSTELSCCLNLCIIKYYFSYPVVEFHFIAPGPPCSGSAY